MAPLYHFRAMTAADLPMVRTWLQAPHVVQWWGNPEKEFELVREDLDHPGMDQYIVEVDGKPFAYLQCYDVHAWPESGLSDQPPGTRGIDQFIGLADMVGCGHGSAFIRAYTDQLLAAGAPRVLTDPDPNNTRAVRAYEKAGFRGDNLIDTSEGVALLMVRDP